jgi:acetoin:2,6-dichlorophenolindophenol oxidoreductase subunit alpha
MQFRERTTRSGLVQASQLEQIDQQVDALIEDAVRKAKSDPKPTPADLLSDVYVAYP